MTPLVWRPPAWSWGALATTLLVLGLLLVRPAPPHVEFTEPSAWCAAAVAGAKVPDQPFPQQALPRKDGTCAQKRAVPIKGGCWTALAAPPDGDDGCGTLGWEHDGRCWVPVSEPLRPPQSATP